MTALRVRLALMAALAAIAGARGVRPWDRYLLIGAGLLYALFVVGAVRKHARRRTLPALPQAIFGGLILVVGFLLVMMGAFVAGAAGRRVRKASAVAELLPPRYRPGPDRLPPRLRSPRLRSSRRRSSRRGYRELTGSSRWEAGSVLEGL